MPFGNTSEASNLAHAATASSKRLAAKCSRDPSCAFVLAASRLSVNSRAIKAPASETRSTIRPATRASAFEATADAIRFASSSFLPETLRPAFRHWSFSSFSLSPPSRSERLAGPRRPAARNRANVSSGGSARTEAHLVSASTPVMSFGTRKRDSNRASASGCRVAAI